MGNTSLGYCMIRIFSMLPLIFSHEAPNSFSPLFNVNMCNESCYLKSLLFWGVGIVRCSMLQHNSRQLYLTLAMGLPPPCKGYIGDFCYLMK